MAHQGWNTCFMSRQIESIIYFFHKFQAYLVRVESPTDGHNGKVLVQARTTHKAKAMQ